jgi:hypothetical protein
MSVLDEVIDELYARHTKDATAAITARHEYETRRGKVHQDDELWEPWSAAFVEWYVVERVGEGEKLPAAAITARAMAASGDERADVARALVTSQRSLFEVRAKAKGGGRVELLDLLGGGEFSIAGERELDRTAAPFGAASHGAGAVLEGVEIGDVAELRLVGVRGDVRFGRTFIYHPKEARAAIVERARAMLGKGSSRRDVIDQIAQLRVQVTRYRHMAPSRVYELGSRIVG